MENFKLSEIIEYTKGILVSENENDIITNISSDSRIVDEHSLFVPLIGEKFDGHDFMKEVYEKGCRNFLCDENHDIKLDANIIKVKDTAVALGGVAKCYRDKFTIPFIGITGSVGKTSTKDILYSVLRVKYNTVKNKENYNNNIGVPQTLLTVTKDTEIAVIEMGMDKKGELDYLTNIVRPNIAVITNIGQSHIMNFSDGQEGIFKAKMEITNSLTNDDLLIVNGDDKYLSTLKGNYDRSALLTYGFNDNNDIYVKEYSTGEKESTFTCVYKEKEYNFKLANIAKHNIGNALIAILIGFNYDLTVEEIQKGLLNLDFSKNRLDVFETSKYRIINDTYNASFDSIMSALDILNSFNTRKVAILGDILELGDYSESIHRKIGKNIKCDLLITIGNHSKYINEETSIENYHFPTKEDFYEKANSLLKENDTILVKASHGIELDKVVEFLKDE